MAQKAIRSDWKFISPRQDSKNDYLGNWHPCKRRVTQTFIESRNQYGNLLSVSNITEAPFPRKIIPTLGWPDYIRRTSLTKIVTSVRVTSIIYISMKCYNLNRDTNFNNKMAQWIQNRTQQQGRSNMQQCSFNFNYLCQDINIIDCLPYHRISGFADTTILTNHLFKQEKLSIENSRKKEGIQ